MMVLMNLGLRNPNIASLADSCVSDVWGRRDRFMQTWILCGEKWIEMWVQMDSAPWFPSGNKWQSCIENNWMPQFDWLANTRGPTFLNPGAWKGLHIDGDVLKAADATDWIVVQGSSATPPVLLDLSKNQVDP